MSHTKMIYLASPYSHPFSRIIERIRETQINDIGAKLQAKTKHAIFPPITVSAHFKRILPDQFGTSFESWKDIDLCAIDHSDELWVVKMEGWKESVGVTAEIIHAKKKKIPVKYINPKTLRFVKA